MIVQPQHEPRQAAIVRTCRTAHPDRGAERRPFARMPVELAVADGPLGELQPAAPAAHPRDDDLRRLRLQGEQNEGGEDHRPRLAAPFEDLQSRHICAPPFLSRLRSKN